MVFQYEHDYNQCKLQHKHFKVRDPIRNNSIPMCITLFLRTRSNKYHTLTELARSRLPRSHVSRVISIRSITREIETIQFSFGIRPIDILSSIG